MTKHRCHSVEFKRQVAQEFLAGETLHGLAKRHDVSRNLIRTSDRLHNPRFPVKDRLHYPRFSAKVLPTESGEGAGDGRPASARDRHREDFMKKITVLSAAATLTLGAALVVGMNSPASAAWELVQIDQQTDTVYRAETAGRSGNVKACYESEVIITTSQWTHSQTGRTRGIVETTDVIDEVQVDNSRCGGR